MISTKRKGPPCGVVPTSVADFVLLRLASRQKVAVWAGMLSALTKEVHCEVSYFCDHRHGRFRKVVRRARRPSTFLTTMEVGLPNKTRPLGRSCPRLGVNVRIVGPCQSACTVLLGHIPRNRICVMPGPSFGFHLAHLPPATATLWRFISRRYKGMDQCAWRAQARFRLDACARYLSLFQEVLGVIFVRIQSHDVSILTASGQSRPSLREQTPINAGSFPNAEERECGRIFALIALVEVGPGRRACLSPAVLKPSPNSPRAARRRPGGFFGCRTRCRHNADTATGAGRKPP